MLSALLLIAGVVQTFAVAGSNALLLEGPSGLPIGTAVVVQVVVALLALLGGVLLFARLSAGRFLVVGAAALTVVLALLGFTGVVGLVGGFFFGVGPVGDVSLLAVLVSIAAAVLALLPSTGRWIATESRSGGQQPPGPQGWHPQQQPPQFPPGGPPPARW